MDQDEEEDIEPDDSQDFPQVEVEQIPFPVYPSYPSYPSENIPEIPGTPTVLKVTSISQVKKNFALIKSKMAQQQKQTEKEKDIQISRSGSSQEREREKKPGKKEVKRPQFRLVVSSDSSESEEAISLSPVVKQGLSERLQINISSQIIRNGFMDKMNYLNVEQKKAAQNWRYILGGVKPPSLPQTNTILTFMSPMNSTIPLKLSDSIQKTTFRESKTSQDIKSSHERQTSQERSQSSQDYDKKQNIMFLRGLDQNKVIEAPTSIDETYEKNKISIKLKTKDFFTFIRLEHEADELRRKQDDFNDHRQRHINQQRGEKYFEVQEANLKVQNDQKEKSFNKSWFVGVALAKRFCKKVKEKTLIVKQQRKLNLTPSRISGSPLPSPRLSSRLSNRMAIPNIAEQLKQSIDQQQLTQKLELIQPKKGILNKSFTKI